MKNRLEEIASELDQLQNMIGHSLSSVMAGELYDIRCKLQDLIEDVEEG